jgi:pentatricopeptide repeat protein
VLGQIVQDGGGSMHVQSASALGKAIAVLKDRLQQGIIIDSYMYVEVLKRCLKQKDLIAAKQVHDCIIKSGMEQNIYVANNLLSAYIRCGRLQEARRVFDALVKKDVFSWNIIIGGYAQHHHAKDAMGLFNQMLQAGVRPNGVTYLSILKTCASPSALKWGKEVHAHIRHGGLESDVRVGTALLKMYAKCGCIKEARHIFDNLTNRDVFSWNVMIGACADSGCGEEAYQLFLQMKRQGFRPDAITYTSILNACASAGALEWVKEVHSNIMDSGLELDLRLASALVHMYAKNGSINDARLVFDRMKERDVVTWSAMIGEYAENGRGTEAYELFLQMKREGCAPNAITFINILNACASAGALGWMKEVHRHILEAGLESDLRVGSALIHMYAKSGSIDDARLVFDRMKERNVITWSVMIGGFAQHGRGHEAYELFLRMQREDCEPNEITYTSILNACASAGALGWMKEVHSHILESGLESDLRVANALVHMYAKSGSINDARILFDRMKERDVMTWNVMINGLAQHGSGHEALELFREMNFKPDGYSFVAALSACSHAGLVDEGHRLFLAMSEDYGIQPTVLHYACMVDLLGRAGRLQEAKRFIDTMPVEPDKATWGALLGACRTYANVELGELVAQQILKLEPHDASTYVLLSNIYAGAGKWDKVSTIRTMMHARGVRKEPGRSWIEVDNKIHYFAVGDLSHPEMKEIYAVLERLIEQSKAEGYVPDTQLVLKNIAEEDKELSLCSHSEKLAIAYGLLRTAPGKPIRIYKNLRVCSDCHTATKFISKVTGREIVARDANRFHHFKDGICSCGDYW